MENEYINVLAPVSCPHCSENFLVSLKVRHQGLSFNNIEKTKEETKKKIASKKNLTEEQRERLFQRVEESVFTEEDAQEILNEIAS